MVFWKLWWDPQEPLGGLFPRGLLGKRPPEASREVSKGPTPLSTRSREEGVGEGRLEMELHESCVYAFSKPFRPKGTADFIETAFFCR